jgi:hypothetical protein
MPFHVPAKSIRNRREKAKCLLRRPLHASAEIRTLVHAARHGNPHQWGWGSMTLQHSNYCGCSPYTFLQLPPLLSRKCVKPHHVVYDLCSRFGGCDTEKRACSPDIWAPKVPFSDIKPRSVISPRPTDMIGPCPCPPRGESHLPVAGLLLLDIVFACLVPFERVSHL